MEGTLLPTRSLNNLEEQMPGQIINHVPRLLKERGFNNPEEAATELMWGIRAARQTAVDWATEGKIPNAIYFRTLANICNFFGKSVGEILEYVPDE